MLLTVKEKTLPFLYNLISLVVLNVIQGKWNKIVCLCMCVKGGERVRENLNSYCKG